MNQSSYEKLEAQLEPTGRLGDEAYTLSRRLGPMACVDVVLVPREEKRKVILVRRDDETPMFGGQWWLVGGSVYKGATLLETAARKTKSEINLDVTVEEIRDTLRTADGNVAWKAFSAIDENWHPYVKESIQRAWERVF